MKVSIGYRRIPLTKGQYFGRFVHTRTLSINCSASDPRKNVNHMFKVMLILRKYFFSKADWSTKYHRHRFNSELYSKLHRKTPLIARFMGPTWGPPGADRTHEGHMLATWILLTGIPYFDTCPDDILQFMMPTISTKRILILIFIFIRSSQLVDLTGLHPTSTYIHVCYLFLCCGWEKPVRNLYMMLFKTCCRHRKGRLYA